MFCKIFHVQNFEDQICHLLILIHISTCNLQTTLYSTTLHTPHSYVHMNMEKQNNKTHTLGGTLNPRKPTFRRLASFSPPLDSCIPCPVQLPTIGNMWANYLEYLDRNRYRTITVSSVDVLVVVSKRWSVFIFQIMQPAQFGGQNFTFSLHLRCQLKYECCWCWDPESWQYFDLDELGPLLHLSNWCH